MSYLHFRIYTSLSILLTLMSCKGNKREFIALDHMTFTNSYYQDRVKISYYILIANPNAQDGQLKNSIVRYVKQRQANSSFMKEAKTSSLNFVFYEKTGNTSYFINNDNSNNAFYSEEISHYKGDHIANYSIAKCDGGFEEKLYFLEAPVEVVFNSCK